MASLQGPGLCLYKHIACNSKKPTLANLKVQLQWKNGSLELLARRTVLLQTLTVSEALLFRGSPIGHPTARADDSRTKSNFSPNEVVVRGSPFTAKILRPDKKAVFPSKDEDYELEEILVLDLKLLRAKASAFHVFINLPDANETTPITGPQFAGSYFHEPRRVKSSEFELQETSFRTGISDIIKELKVTEQPTIMVTIVPCGADKESPVIIKNMYIELE